MRKQTHISGPRRVKPGRQIPPIQQPARSHRRHRRGKRMLLLLAAGTAVAAAIRAVEGRRERSTVTSSEPGPSADRQPAGLTVPPAQPAPEQLSVLDTDFDVTRVAPGQR